MKRKILLAAIIVASIIQVPWYVYAMNDMKEGAAKTVGVVVDRTGRRDANPVYEFRDQQGNTHRIVNHFEDMQSTNLLSGVLANKNGHTATVYYKLADPAKATVTEGLGFYATLFLPLSLVAFGLFAWCIVTILLYLYAQGYISPKRK